MAWRFLQKDIKCAHRERRFTSRTLKVKKTECYNTTVELSTRHGSTDALRSDLVCKEADHGL